MNKIKKFILSFFCNDIDIPTKTVDECYFRTGDMIAFSGKGFISNVIKKWTNYDISHVGIVYVCSKTGTVYVCESTTTVSSQDDISHKILKGVQMHKLSKRVAEYDGQIYFYPQAKTPSFVAENEMSAWLFNVHKQEIEYDYVQAILSGVDITVYHEIFLFRNSPEFSKLFCSELVAKVKKIQYAIDMPTSAFAHCNPSELTPADLCKSNIFIGRTCELVA